MNAMIQILIPKGVKERFRKKCEENNTTMSEVLRSFVENPTYSNTIEHTQWLTNLVRLRFRVDEESKKRFQQGGESMSTVLRGYIRSYIDTHSKGIAHYLSKVRGGR